MSRPYVRKTAPQRHVQPCMECAGAGITQSEDWDDEGRRLVNVRCEACDGLGELVDCSRCDEPTALTYAEEGGGVCGPCRAGLEQGDARAEIARIRRWVA